MIKAVLKVTAICLVMASLGCAPVIIGGGAAGAYKVATDERSLGRMVDDSNISAAIKAELSSDAVVDAVDIDVDTIDGNVILTGIVKSEAQIDRAIEIAKGMEGVKSVKNNLRAGTKTVGQSIDDRVLFSKIKTNLIKAPGVSSMGIDVDVEKGVVTLSGIVASKTEKDAVLKIAREAKGTAGVVDNLTIKKQ